MTDLAISHIEKQLGSLKVLKGISLQMGHGEIISLLGRSGSGKTTLLRSVAGLETPERGSIQLDGKVLFDSEKGINLPPDKRGLGLVFQSYALWPHRTVFENVAYGLVLRKVSREETRERVDEVLSRIGLAGLAQRYPHQLSGGQQQRVALARALAYRPPVLLLDEPLSNLDAKLREEARVWLRELIQQFQLSALYVTHDQVEAMAVSDRILFLRDGLIEQAGSPSEIYLQPSTARSADFMGTNNVLRGTIAMRDGLTYLRGSGWELVGEARGPLPQGEDAIGYLRVEKASVLSSSGPNSIKVKLIRSAFLGDRIEYHMKCGDLSIRAWGDNIKDPGDYWVDCEPGNLWLFPPGNMQLT